MGEKKPDFFEKGKRSSIIAGLGTFVFALAKAIIGILSGSIVLIGDAIHSAADSFSAFVVWLGLKISQKDPTEKFPYGFYKVENISSLFVSLLIFYAGYSIARRSIRHLTSVSKLNYPLFALSIAIIDAAVMFIIGSYEIKKGREINSQSLIADGKESRLHLLSSSIVLIGLVSNLLGILYLEAIAGILISLFIFQAGYETGKESVFALLDVSPSKDIEQDIIEAIGNISGVEGFANLKLRKSGPFIFGECTVKIRKQVEVDRAHEISNNLQEKIKDKVDRIDTFTIRIEPYQTIKSRIVIPTENKDGLKSKISSHFGRANYFAFVSLDKENNEIESVEIKENEFKEKEVRAGLAAAKSVVKEKIDALITKMIGEISFHTLRDHLVDIYKSEGKTVEEITDNYLKNDLSRLPEPTRNKE